jgi:hypothetical protein
MCILKYVETWDEKVKFPASTFEGASIVDLEAFLAELDVIEKIKDKPTNIYRIISEALGVSSIQLIMSRDSEYVTIRSCVDKELTKLRVPAAVATLSVVDV